MSTDERLEREHLDLLNDYRRTVKCKLERLPEAKREIDELAMASRQRIKASWDLLNRTKPRNIQET